MRLDDGLAPIKRQAIIWTNADPTYWRIYAALGVNELMSKQRLSLSKRFCDFAGHLKINIE